MKHITTTILLLFITFQVFARALDPPLVTCLEVHENGEVTINWRSLDNSVMQFNIFYRTDGTTWSLAVPVSNMGIDNSYRLSNTYVNANEEAYYFYITALYPGGIEKDSEILRTIFLVVDNSTAGTATLLWNSVSTPLPEGSANSYQIYASIYESGIPANWYLIADDVENTLYNYVIPNGVCFDSINFKIDIPNSYGCSSVSNITGNWFSETILPNIPILDSVSINLNENIVLGWEHVTNEDIAGIIIYRKVGISWPDSTRIVIPYTTFYEDTTQFPCLKKDIQYAIASFDSCGNKSIKTEVTAQRPIFLEQPEYDLCSRTINISWEPYINSSPSIEKYQIWSSTGTNNPILLDEVSGTDIVYYHTDVEKLTNYHYFVRAIFGDHSSTSCTKSVTTGTYIEPTSIYLANSSVELNNSIVLTIDPDIQPDSCTWNIYRSDAGGGNELLIKSLNRADITISPYNYLDETADGSLDYYTYTVDVYDSCNLESRVSNTLKTVYLEGTQLSDTENKLMWNAFEGWDSEVSGYNIFRFTGTNIPDTPIDSVDASTFEYTDNIGLVSTTESKFSYFVQAKESVTNSYGYKEKSNSNIVNFFRETELYMANAFRPNGINTVFKPVTTGFGGSNYLFQIYNRWGQLIFESNNPAKGWDGTYNGNKSPQGTYIYRLVYSSVFGESKSQRGSVTLID